MKQTMILTAQQRQLVEDNLPVVRQVIARHIRCNEQLCGMGRDDLFQEGAWALCRAAMTYDGEGRGVPFSAYARPVIRNHLLDHCRRLLNQREHFPTVPLDASDEDGPPSPGYWLAAGDDAGDWDDRILAQQLLEQGKRTYSGVAKLGVEALEWKIKGYSGADIARLYNTKPNQVGAWISRATKKMKADGLAALLLEQEPKNTAA